jgi:hypothetical protein
LGVWAAKIVTFIADHWVEIVGGTWTAYQEKE